MSPVGLAALAARRSPRARRRPADAAVAVHWSTDTVTVRVRGTAGYADVRRARRAVHGRLEPGDRLRLVLVGSPDPQSAVARELSGLRTAALVAGARVDVVGAAADLASRWHPTSTRYLLLEERATAVTDDRCAPLGPAAVRARDATA